MKAPGLLSRMLAAAPHRPVVVRYGLSVCFVAIAVFLIFPFTNSARAPYFPLLLVAVTLSAIFGGFGPGVFATCVAVPSGFYALVEPRFTWAVTYPGDLARVIIILPAGLFISWLIGAFVASQAELQRSEDQFRLLATSVSVGIFQTDVAGAWTYANPACETISGIRPAGTRSPWDQTVHPEDRERVTSEWSAALAECKPWSSEYRYQFAQEEVRWVRGTASPIRVRGKMIGYIGTITDITAITAANLKLAESEARFRQLADAMPQMVWTAHADGSVDYYNSKWYERTKLIPGRYGDESWKRLLHPDDVEPCLERWSEALRFGQPYEIEYRFEDKNGRYRWHLGRAIPVRDAGAKVVKWIGTCTDIDDLKRTQDKLLRAEKLAAAGKLAASIAHELNTPLGSVLNLIYLARVEGNAQLKNQYLKSAEGELERVSSLANRCLSIYSGGTSKEHVRLDELADEVVGVFRDSAVSRGISIYRRTDGNPTVFGSHDDLRHLVVNLVSNAIDALPENGKLGVYTRYGRDSKTARRCVRMTVADNGSGIANQVRKLIFDPFFTTKKETGTGLGLWIARNVVENHGGTIRVRSSARPARHGTVVSICLPAMDPAEGTRMEAG